MTITTNQPRITVVGSCSIDLVLNTYRTPKPNETVIAYQSDTFFGGKGANQAVGTSRLGAQVYLVGCVGMDPFGQQVMRNLVDEGVNVGFLAETERAETGTAYVTAAEGKNAIVVVPAANDFLKPKHVEAAEKYIHNADLVLIQLEIPMNVVEYTVQLAKKYNKKVGIYAAPATQLSAEVIEYAAFIIAKSIELSNIFGDQQPEDIMRKYPNKLFVRDDSNSTTYFNGESMKYYRSEHVAVPHKMGMGDAFTSGFSIALCHGNPIDECVKFGNEISYKCSEKRGSQTNLPYLKDFS